MTICMRSTGRGWVTMLVFELTAETAKGVTKLAVERTRLEGRERNTVIVVREGKRLPMDLRIEPYENKVDCLRRIESLLVQLNEQFSDLICWMLDCFDYPGERKTGVVEDGGKYVAFEADPEFVSDLVMICLEAV